LTLRFKEGNTQKRKDNLTKKKRFQLIDERKKLEKKGTCFRQQVRKGTAPPYRRLRKKAKRKKKKGALPLSPRGQRKASFFRCATNIKEEKDL